MKSRGDKEMPSDNRPPGDNRPSVYREDGIWVIRGSALASCQGELSRTARGESGAPFPDFLVKAFDEGNMAENAILDAMVEQLAPLRLSVPFKLVGEQEELELPVTTKAKIRLHPDGFLEVNGKRTVVVEAKFLGESLCKKIKYGEKIEAYPRYSWQFAAEMVATGLPGLFVVGEKVRGEGGVEPEGESTFIGTNMDGEDVWLKLPVRVTRYETPPHSRGELLGKALGLVSAFKRGVTRECDIAQFPCPFYQDCDGGKKPDDRPEFGVAPPLDKVTKSKLAHWCLAWERGRRKERDGKEEKKKAAVEIQKLADELGKGIGEMSTGRLVARKQSRRGNVSWKSVAEENIEGLDDMDLDGYRGADSEWWEVVEAKQEKESQ